MDVSKPKVQRHDLLGPGLKAEEHWREHRPKMVAALERQGTLYEVLKEAEDRFLDLETELQSQGLHPVEAISQALREFILLPPESDAEPEGW